MQLSGGSNQILRTCCNTLRIVSAPGFSAATASDRAALASRHGRFCAASAMPLSSQRARTFRRKATSTLVRMEVWSGVGWDSDEGDADLFHRRSAVAQESGAVLDEGFAV